MTDRQTDGQTDRQTEGQKDSIGLSDRQADDSLIHKIETLVRKQGEREKVLEVKTGAEMGIEIG